MGVAHKTKEPAVTAPVDDDGWNKIWNKQNLEQWLNDGLTRQQIVDKVAELSGRPKMSLPSVSMAASRWGIPMRRARYEKTLPWRVVGGHGMAKEAVRLRTLGKLLAGGNPPDKDRRQLDQWIELLRNEGSPVIVYYPDSPDGFYPVYRDKIDKLDVEYVDPVSLYDSLPKG